MLTIIYFTLSQIYVQTATRKFYVDLERGSTCVYWRKSESFSYMWQHAKEIKRKREIHGVEQSQMPEKQN